MLFDLTDLSEVQLTDSVKVEVEKVELQYNPEYPDLPLIRFDLSIKLKNGTLLSKLEKVFRPFLHKETKVFTLNEDEKLEDNSGFKSFLQRLEQLFPTGSIEYQIVEQREIHNETEQTETQTDTDTKETTQSNDKKFQVTVIFVVKDKIYWEIVNYQCNSKDIAGCFYDFLQDHIHELVE